MHWSVLTCEKTDSGILFSLPVPFWKCFLWFRLSPAATRLFFSMQNSCKETGSFFPPVNRFFCFQMVQMLFLYKASEKAIQSFFSVVTAGTNNGLKTTLCSGAASVFSFPACRSAAATPEEGRMKTIGSESSSFYSVICPAPTERVLQPGTLGSPHFFLLSLLYAHLCQNTSVKHSRF